MFRLQSSSEDKNVTIIKVDPWSILKIVLILLGLVFLYLVRDILLIILGAVFLAAIITPAVDFFEKKKFPRWLGALIVYLIVFLIIFLIGFAAGQGIVDKFKLFVDNLPGYLRTFFQSTQIEVNGGFEEFLGGWLNKGLGEFNIFSILGTVAGQLITFLMIMVLAFYISVEKQSFSSFIKLVLPDKYRQPVKKFLGSARRDIGAWARGMLILMGVIGLLTYIGLLILGVNFPVVLALIAGFTEIIPWVGPWIGVIPAVIIALAQSPIKALLVLGFYLVVQQIGNAFITPHVMRRTVGLDPLLVLVVLLVGGRVAGAWGMLLAVPIATIIAIIVKQYLKVKAAAEKKV